MFRSPFKFGALKTSLTAGLLAGFVAGTAAQAQEINVPYIKETTTTLKLAHGLPPGSAYDMGANRFAELVSMYTRGEIEVKVFPSSQLGKEQDTAKDVQLGVLDMTLVAINVSVRSRGSGSVQRRPIALRSERSATGATRRVW